MTRTYCDRCGKEIDIRSVKNVSFKDDRYLLPAGYMCVAGNATSYTAPRFYDFRKDLELCEDCFYEVMEHATTPPIEDTSDSVEVDVPGKPDETMEIAACCYGCDHLEDVYDGYFCGTARTDEMHDLRKRNAPKHGRECPWFEPKQEGGF